ncbi:hypothetical protein EW146_g7056 [Bondarzewia mesenterica]|uniref:Uncharacterized protein n=1 Tax=Bondarzewia mesenterica TaxID=1095465 RepID=A0A4S4LMM1_9AGAM|nr:hypothetical protein EW146_g7056 [Bondarzewia mesenterica]
MRAALAFLHTLSPLSARALLARAFPHPMSSLDPTSSSTEMSRSQPTTNSDNPAMEEASPPPVYQAPLALTWREYSDMAQAISSIGSMHAMHADNQIAIG